MSRRILAMALRQLPRDLGRGGLRLPALAVLVAVAAVTAVGFFTDRVGRALSLNAAQMLGADLALVSSRPIPEALAAQARERGLTVAATVEFPSVASARETFALVEVKAVSPAYPLRGKLRTAGSIGGKGRPVEGIPAPGELWGGPGLASRLGVRVGERLRLGRREFVLARILTWEPDRGGSIVAVAPRVLINLADLASTGLVGEASRVRYRLLAAGPAAVVGAWQEWLARELPDGIALQDLANARPEVRIALERAGRFLGLAALCAVLVAAMAVLLAAQNFVEGNSDAGAVLRCLGLTRAGLLGWFGLRLLLLGLCASVAGAAAGYLAQFGLAALLAEWFGGALPAPTPLPLLAGLLTGLLVLGGYALPQLMRLGAVPPLRVLRRELGPPPASLWLSGLLALGALGLLLWWQAGELRLALLAGGGGLLAVPLLLAASAALVWLLRRLRARLPAGPVRYGLSALGRAPGLVALQCCAFGIGILALLLLGVVRTDLVDSWQRRIPPDAPDTFLINVLPGQRADLTAFLAARGVADVRLWPMIRARLAAISGRPVRAGDFTAGRARRLALRDYNLSFGEVLAADNRVVGGKWPAPGFSVEAGLARTLGLKLGDRLRFEIAGEALEAPITSLREVQWDSFNPNFFVLGDPALLAGYPATWITSLRLPPAGQVLVRDLIARFPNVTVLNVGSLLAQVRGIMARGTAAVEYVFLFTLAAGLVVLLAGIEAGREQRRREVALLRALGQSRRALLQSVAVEFALIGAVAGAVAALFAAAIGLLLGQELFGLEAAPVNPLLLPLGIGAGALGVGLAGVAGTWPLTRRPPWRSLQG